MSPLVGKLDDQARVSPGELVELWESVRQDWALVELTEHIIDERSSRLTESLDIPRLGDDVVLASYRVDPETRTIWLEQEVLPCVEMTNLPTHLRDDIAVLVADPGRDFRGSSGCIGYVLEDGRIVRAGMLVSMHPEPDVTIVLLIRIPQAALDHVAAVRAERAASTADPPD